MVSAFSDKPLLAQSFATEVMAGVDAQMIMYGANAPPVLTEVIELAQQENPNLAAVGEAGAVGEPLPAVPAMSSVFRAQGDAWTLIFRGAPVQSTLDNTAAIVRDALEG
jgi:arabinogalactan oligomer / maltooligosaccharide transport system substrate-binding protein